MADITFSCPHCNQAIQCDEAWGGQQIQCPICQGALIAPAQPTAPTPAPTPAPAPVLRNSLVPQPPSGPTPRLSFQQNAQKPAVPQRNIPIRNLAAPPPKTTSTLVKILIWVGVLAVLGVGGYFGWGLVEKWQDKANEKSRQMAADSDGGQVGHIQELNNVLEATDPSNPRLDKLGRRPPPSGPRQRDNGVPMPIGIDPDE